MAEKNVAFTPIETGDMSEIPGPGLGGAIIKAYVASHPLLALAALALATAGRLRYAMDSPLRCTTALIDAAS